jgi:hypothetical protein
MDIPARGVVPVEQMVVEATPERADDLERRLAFIRVNIKPYLNG